jgi:hypothetical protein
LTSAHHFFLNLGLALWDDWSYDMCMKSTRSTKSVKKVSIKSYAAAQVAGATKRYETAREDRIIAQRLASPSSAGDAAIVKAAWERENDAYAAMVREQSWARSVAA